MHEIVFNGNGGYGWDVVYNLPIRYRDFIYNQMAKYYEEKNKKIEESQKKVPQRNTPTPTYKSKASKK